MPVFVIGMKRFPERYERVLKRLDDAGIDAQLFPGVDLVDGDALAPEEKVNPYPHFFRLGDWPLGLGEVGCYFAHYRLLKHILTLKAPRVLILECDAVARPFAKELMDEVAALDEKHELVYLYCLGGAWSSSFRTLSHNRKLHRGFGHHYSSAAYAITREAAKKLLPQMTPMRTIYDSVLGKPYRTGLNTFVVRDNVFNAPIPGRHSIIKNANVRYMPPNPVHRAFYRALCALLAKPIQNSSWRRWPEPLKRLAFSFIQRKLYLRRLRKRSERDGDIY